MGWKEWTVVGILLVWAAIAGIIILSMSFPLEEPCRGCRSSCAGFGEGPVFEVPLPDRYCPIGKHAWSSGDPFGWGWMWNRVERALR